MYFHPIVKSISVCAIYFRVNCVVVFKVTVVVTLLSKEKVFQTEIFLKANKDKSNEIKDKVGMAGSKSTQKRLVGIITSTIHPYTCFDGRN